MSYAKSAINTPEEISQMSLTQMSNEVTKKNDLRNLVYYYNTTRKDGEQAISVSDTFTWYDTREGKAKYRVIFKKPVKDDAPERSVAQFKSIPEVRGFIIALLALRITK
jgi:hypothetical protein